MDIDDILNKEEFKSLDLFLDNEMEKCAGGPLINQMIYVLESRMNARNWFYSNVKALGGKRPYDICKAGKSDQIRDILGQIEYGVFA
ncbi:MAG: MbcA/ParS/Xre antitoxin family protein [archaeon]